MRRFAREWSRRHRIVEALGVGAMIGLAVGFVAHTYVVRGNPVPRWMWDVYNWEFWPFSRHFRRWPH